MRRRFDVKAYAIPLQSVDHSKKEKDTTVNHSTTGLALTLAILAACSSTATGSMSSPAPETDAAPPTDTASVDTGTITRPDVNVTETTVTDSAQTDVAPRDAPTVAEDVLNDADQDAAETSDANSGEDTAPEASADAFVADASVDAPVADTATDAELPLGQPILELLPPSSLALRSGAHEVQYTVRSTGRPIALKKVEVFFRGGNTDSATTQWYRRWNQPTGGTRFLRDGVVVNPSEYRFVGWVFPMAAGVSSITVEWQTEEEVTRTGHTYTLAFALTGTIEMGDTLQVQVSTGAVINPMHRGRLTPLGSNFGLYHMPGPHVWTGMGRCVRDEIVWDGYVAPSSFVWSDRSSPTHSWTDCATAESSDDWFTRAEMPTYGTYTLTP